MKVQKVILAYLWLLTLIGSFGCSRIEIGLDWAPRILTNRLDDVFDFSSNKESEIKKQIQDDLNEIKSPAAKQLSELLKKIDFLFFKQPLDKSPTPQQLKEIFNNFITIQKNFISGFKKTAQLTLKDLNDHNKKSFLLKNTEKFEKEIKQSLNDNQFESKLYERYEKVYEFLFDDLNQKQIDLIQNFIKSHKIYLRNRLLLRKKWTEDFAQAMNENVDLNSLFFKQFSGQFSEDQTVLGRTSFIDHTIQLNLEIWLASTYKQKQSFRRAIQKYIIELNKIATSGR